MANHPHESRTPVLDLGQLFSSPLTALIDAQSHAAHTTLAYIRAVGCDGDRLRTTRFHIGPESGAAPPSQDARDIEMSLPTLCLLPIPSFRIAEANIEFHARIVGVSRAPAGTEAGGAAAPLRLQASLTHKRRSPLGHTESGDYTMQVKLRVVHDELACGMEQLLHRALSARSEP